MSTQVSIGSMKTLTSRSQDLARRLVLESTESLVNEGVQQMHRDVSDWQMALGKLEVKFNRISQKIKIAQSGRGLVALLYWLVLPWLRRRSSSNEAARNSLDLLIQECEADVEALASSAEARERFIEEVIRNRVAAFRRSVFNNLEEVLGVKEFGRQRMYWTDGFTTVRDRRNDWWLQVHCGYLCPDGYALVVTKYTDQIGGRRRIYSLGILDLDNSRVVEEVKNFGGDYIIVQEDSPEKICFTMCRRKGCEFSCVFNKAARRLTWTHR